MFREFICFNVGVMAKTQVGCKTHREGKWHV